MEAFNMLDGLVAPLDRSNVDTDAIIPKQFLKSIERTGFGANLFDEWRYLDYGEPGKDCTHRPLNTEFVLNQPRYQDAQILLARENFGCGSSREHAPWALLDYGFRVIIAPSFAEIFASNCCKNGILPVTLKAEIIDSMFKDVEALSGYRLNVNLTVQEVKTPQGDIYRFEIDPFRKKCLLQGLDEISLTMHYSDEIKAFEEKRQQVEPWLFAPK